MEPNQKRLLTRAEGYLELDLPDRAYEVLERVDAEARDSFEYTFLAAEALRAKNQYVQAAPLFEQARQHRPESIGVYIGLGWCYKRIGRLPDAIEALHEADRQCQEIGEEEAHALVMYNLSCYYALADMKNELLYWLNKALEHEESYRKQIAEETDFDGIRDDPDFQAVANPKRI